MLLPHSRRKTCHFCRNQGLEAFKVTTRWHRIRGSTLTKYRLVRRILYISFSPSFAIITSKRAFSVQNHQFLVLSIHVSLLAKNAPFLNRLIINYLQNGLIFPIFRLQSSLPALHPPSYKAHCRDISLFLTISFYLQLSLLCISSGSRRRR